MHRIDGPGATVDKKFTEGDPVAGVPATVVTDDFMNDVQEELISLLNAAGITPVKGTQDQVLKSVLKILQDGLGNYSAYQLVTGSAGLTAGKMYLVTAVGVTPTLPILANSASGDTVTVAARVDTTIAVSGAGLINNPAFGSTTSISMRAGEQIQFVSNGSSSWQISNYSKNPQYQPDTAFTTAGTAAALTLTPIPPIPAYVTNLRFRVRFNQVSTPTTTINVSGQGAKLLKQYDANGAKVPAVYAVNQMSDIEYDGFDFVLMNQLPTATVAVQQTPRGQFSNLRNAITGASANILITADQLTVSDASGETIVLNSLSRGLNTAAVASSSVNGMTTGATVANTWYAVYIWRNPATGGILATGDSSFTTPTAPAAGYTQWARVGCFRTDGSANKWPLRILQRDRYFQYSPAAGTNLTAAPIMVSGAMGSPAAPPTWGAVPTAAFVPPTAATVSVFACGYSGGVIVAPNNSYSGQSTSGLQGAPVMVSPPAGNSASQSTTADFVLESGNIYYASSQAVSSLSCLGFGDSF